ncbi:MAG: SBBP repeat-containing protein [Candidatus Zixiibacteriota bacterium]|nr:MAG: SBBP repeat-containing protein [candidate division Zixibacteria bacterium]
MLVICIALLMATNAVGNSIPDSDIGANNRAIRNFARQPIGFIENRGQFEAGVCFQASRPGVTFRFQRNEFSYIFEVNEASNNEYPAIPGKKYYREMPVISNPPCEREIIQITARLMGSNPDPVVLSGEKAPGRVNYFIGNDPNSWITDIPLYSDIVYSEIYPLTDLRFSGDSRSLKYEFILNPGADLSLIEVQYDGIEEISITPSGELCIKTRFGEIYEKPPYIYQTINGIKKSISGQFRLTGVNTFGFSLNEDYYKNFQLIIDPELSYSTYLGGSGQDWAHDITLDPERNIYITGFSGSANYPTAEPYSGTMNGSGDIIISKLSASGDSLIYSTFLGGSSYDWATGIRLDGSGNMYITGITYSSDFPTVNAYDDSFNGGDYDAVVCKLSADGDSLLYSTFLGGSDYDDADCIDVLQDGSAYICGTTQSPNFPTLNAYDSSLTGTMDAFVTRFTQAGDSLVYSTFLGGGSDEYGQGIAVDKEGNAYISGQTTSSDFPTVNYYDDSLGGWADAFICKLPPSGDSLINSTYIGGSDYDDCWDIDIDYDGNFYITGSAMSADFPTFNAYDDSHNGNDDIFVTKLSDTGNSLVFSTFLGGAEDDVGYGIAVDDYNNVCITGRTSSSNFPTVDAYDDSYNGSADVFAARFSNTGQDLQYSTFLGGSSQERCDDIAVDILGNAYIAGWTESSDYPTVNPYSGSNSGYWDVIVSKISFGKYSPVAYWALDEGADTTAYDSTANHNDGAIVGADWVTGRHGFGLQFSYYGDDAVIVPHSPSLDITEPFVIEAWVKPTDVSDYLVIVDKYEYDMGTGLEYGYTFYINNDNRLRLTVYSGDNGQRTVIGTSYISDDTWHHVAGKYDGNHASVFVDGFKEKESDWAYTPASTDMNLGIGFRLSGWGIWTPFNGVIDEVRIFSGGLPACDYVVGDVNGSDSYNGLDITYGVNFFKGSSDPMCPFGSCSIPPCDSFFYCGDVNGSCSYNGLDITYGVNYFKGGADPIPCSNCPPGEGIVSFIKSDQSNEPSSTSEKRVKY